MCQSIATALELSVGHPFAGFRHSESRLLGTRDDVLAWVHAAPPLVCALPFESLHAHLAIARGVVFPRLAGALKCGVAFANPASSQSAPSCFYGIQSVFFHGPIILLDRGASF